MSNDTAIQRWLQYLQSLFERPLPDAYRARQTNEPDLRSEYSAEAFQVVDRVLTLLCEVFGFAVGDRFKFRTDDLLTDIYGQVYPDKGRPDAMEYEHLTLELRREFGFDLVEECGQQPSLHQIIAAAIAALPNVPGAPN